MRNMKSAYKQDDGVAYHARDMAVVRGQIEKAAVVLASATPSIESRVNAEQGRYGHLQLPARYGGQPMPVITAIDLKRKAAPRGKWIAPRARRGDRRDLGARRTGAALSQSARLCAADGVPPLRPSIPMSELHGVARRTSLSPRARLPSLRPYRTAAGACPECGEVRRSRPAGPASSGWPKKSATLWPDARCLDALVGFSRRHGTAAARTRGGGARRLRYRHRHAARRQGP